MNVHQGVRNVLNHRAAVVALLAQPTPPLPALFRPDPANPGHPHPHHPNPIAQFVIRKGRPCLHIPAPIPLTDVPDLMRWLADIQADVPESDAHDDPSDNPDDYSHLDYNPHPGAD